MTIEIAISSAVVGAIVSFVGNIIAAKIAQKTAIKAAQEATAQEIKKLERTWEREDIVSSDEEFAAMAGAVGRYIHRDTIDNGAAAAERVSYIRSKEHGELGIILDRLHASLDERDLERADHELTNAINEKRRLKGHPVDQGTIKAK
mgnify:CR=1 FL=1